MDEKRATLNEERMETVEMCEEAKGRRDEGVMAEGMNCVFPYQDQPDLLPDEVVPFIPTPMAPIKAIFSELLTIAPDDVVLDLGCGDGRTMFYAAETFHIKALGLELRADLVADITRRAAERGLSPLVHAVCGSFVTHDNDDNNNSNSSNNNDDDNNNNSNNNDNNDNNNNDNSNDITAQLLAQATVVVLYIVPKVLKMLEPRIKRWVRDDPKRRCVTINFPFAHWQPTATNKKYGMGLFLYDKHSADVKQTTEFVDYGCNPAY